MYKWFAAVFLIAGSSLAACSGGSNSGGYGSVTPHVAESPAPYMHTTPPAAQSNLPVSETVAGSPAWVDPASHHTLYYLDVDTPTGGTCTGACLMEWPVLVPNAYAQASGYFTIITRSDGTGKQFAYQGHPLYKFAGDNGPDQANGNNLPFAGGHWHVARPTSATTMPSMSPSPYPMSSTSPSPYPNGY